MNGSLLSIKPPSFLHFDDLFVQQKLPAFFLFLFSNRLHFIYLGRVQEQLLIITISISELPDCFKATHKPAIYLPEVFCLNFCIMTSNDLSEHLFERSVHLYPIGKVNASFEVGFRLPPTWSISSYFFSSYEDFK